METQTFQVRNIREGLEQIKTELGANAVIVSTKRITGKDGKHVLEISAAAELEPQRKRPSFFSSRTSDFSKKGQRQEKQDEEQHTHALEHTLSALEQAVTMLTTQLADVRSELRHLSLQQRMQHELLERVDAAAASTPRLHQGSGAQEAFKLGLERLWSHHEEGDAEDDRQGSLMRGILAMHQALLAQGVLERDVESLIASVLADEEHGEVPLTQLVIEHMSRWIHVTEPLWHGTPKDGVDIHVLVGPSGVGKTTTLAKIAAHAQYIAHKKVGVVAADAFRIGATFQLETYAELLDVPIAQASSITELREAVDELEPCDLILVDSTGYNMWEDEEQGQCIPLDLFPQTYARDDAEHRVHMHLVLASHTPPDDVLQLLERFGTLPIESIIFTKVDEARNLGALFSIVHASGLPISLLTDGRAVPGDVHLPDARELAHWILRGYRGRVLTETETYSLEE